MVNKTGKNMKIKKPAFIPPYWDEGNWNNVKWYRKGKWKRIFRKKWIREQIKNQETEI